jgi:hypothetical protein
MFKNEQVQQLVFFEKLHLVLAAYSSLLASMPSGFGAIPQPLGQSPSPVEIKLTQYLSALWLSVLSKCCRLHIAVPRSIVFHLLDQSAFDAR